MIFKIARFLLTILLLPFCIAITANFYKGIVSIKAISETGFIFILGALSYSLFHFILFKLDFLYVLGHESMHAIATLFSGGKVLNIKVSKKQGSVRTTTPNMFVVLAPYLVPIYTVLLALIYYLLSFFIDIGRHSQLFIFLIGFTLMFHIAYTAQSIKEKQSDLIKTGYLFSVEFVYIINLIIVFAIISFLFKRLDFLDFLSLSYSDTKIFYQSIWRQLFL